jgi:hypothetical protein
LYNNAYDDTYFVNRFVDGLKEEICATISLHRPQDVDTTSALALLQEEELARGKNKFGGYAKNYVKQNVDKKKLSEVDKGKGEGQAKEAEDKWAALREMRKKNGLCFKYGGKWVSNHKCPAHVPLHVLEEILDALEPEDDSDDDLSPDPEDEVIATVTQSSDLEGAKRRTMKLCGLIGKFTVLILVD